MKTVLRLPIYIEVVTDNVDRKLVSDQVNQILFPHVFEFLSNAEFRKKHLVEIRENLEVETFQVRFLTEHDLFTDRDKEKFKFKE